MYIFYIIIYDKHVIYYKYSEMYILYKCTYTLNISENSRHCVCNNIKMTMCVYVDIHTHIHTHIHTRTYTLTCTIHTHIYMYIYMYIYVYIYVYILTCILGAVAESVEHRIRRT